MCTGLRRTAFAKAIQNQTIPGLNDMDTTQIRFAVCIRNDGSENLEPGKTYQVLPDGAATADGYIRVIDESGEDYLYPQDYFLPIESLHGISIRYDNPTEPVAQEDWDVLR
jgi:hypothetical protein